MARRVRVEIRGAVQGVGFRPFIYRLADEMGLHGWVVNDAAGVTLEVEGDDSGVERFVERIPGEKPATAVIESFETRVVSPRNRSGFEIRSSDESGPKTVQVLPDVATCPSCLAELLDPADRRYGYPFTNCTHCGPRFSILRSLPYDRPNTTMDAFAMCERCRGEYEDPADRRFHAQPNACAECGPRMALWGPDGTAEVRGPGTLREAARALERGEILAAKGLGGFHLLADARNGETVARLRDKKPRREKPFALMVRDLDQAGELCRIDAAAAAALSSPESPILLLERRAAAGVHPAVAPSNPYLGIMLPYTPLHHLLLRECGFPLVATSGNLSEEPICTSESDAVARLGGVAERFLVHDRPIERHVDDSVAWTIAGRTRLLRRARGFAPRPVLVERDLPAILAVGAHLKNTVALGTGRRVFVSQHIGDMETDEARMAFERVIEDFLRLYETTPVLVAHDLHPDYVSTRWVERSPRVAGLPRVAVQHHHAHLVSCLADNGFEGPALGVTWDGTGLGTDDTVWGGEFLLGDASSFERLAHLRPFRLPGGEAAIREPRRTAVALLWEVDRENVWNREDLEAVGSLHDNERRILSAMLDRGVNSPVTTSAGRLYDGVAALVGLRQTTSFEGQAAMELEFVADRTVRDAYPMPIDAYPAESGGTVRVLDWAPLVEAVIADVRGARPVPVIAARFHNALADGIARIAAEIGAGTVALTGGCFQNRLLTERSLERLTPAGHRVLLHRQVPPNDGGIALGQILVAASAER